MGTVIIIIILRGGKHAEIFEQCYFQEDDVGKSIGNGRSKTNEGGKRL